MTVTIHPTPMPLTLTVNGEPSVVNVGTQSTLLTVLRETLQLTGTKCGCNQGVCGACTVLINRGPVRACLTLAVNCEGVEIETVEGVARGGEYSAVQRSLVQTGAVQCGFCTPGIVMTATALLRSNPQPTESEVIEGLSGNLCRCSGYTKVIEAILIAKQSEKDLAHTESAIGASIPRREVGDKVTGRALYTDDLYRPRMLYGAVLGSPHAHAQIKSRDISTALAEPGVKAVITGADFPRRQGSFVRDETPLAGDKVRYMGEPVAAVAAVDLATARRALRLIEITYEELPAVFSVDDAMAAGAPGLHEDFEVYEKLNLRGADDSVARQETGRGESNVLWRVSLGEGDVDSAWAECDVVVEGTYETHAQHHAYMEPCSALAEVDADGRLTIHSPSQSVNQVQARVADALGLDLTQVRAISPRVGGAFGGKGGPHVQPLAAALARATGRPVKITLSRADDFEMLRSRHPSRYRMKTGARRDGTLLAREIEAVFDAGAYTDETPAVMCFGVFAARGPYNVPNVRASGVAVYTNKLRTGSFRGFGGPQAAFASESQLDELAEALEMDPIELRLKNAMGPGDRYLGGQTVQSCGFEDCLQAVREAARKAGAGESSKAPEARKRGVGIAASLQICGSHSTSAHIHLHPDGSVALSTGVVDLGQGSDTVLSQICAGALEIPADRVAFATPDTDSTPYNWKTSASRVTYTAGRAVLAAAEDVRAKILDAAADMLECAVEDLELRPGGRVGISGIAEREVSFREISMRAHFRVGGPIMGSHSLMFDGEKIDPKRALLDGFVFDNFGIYVFGAHAIEVEVDCDTGRIEVLRAWCAHDVGKAINPVAVEGQIQGAFVQGLGYALFEEMVWDDGRLTNPSFMDYRIPGSVDVPSEIIPIIIEAPEPTGPFGAKGSGEPGLGPVAPAIANAVFAATGHRFRALPMTAETVRNTITDTGDP